MVRTDVLYLIFSSTNYLTFPDDGSDDIPGTPQDNKKIKKMNKKTSEKSKHTRIVKMLDSSDDDGNFKGSVG